MLLLVTEKEFKKLLQKNFIMALGNGRYRLDCFGHDSTTISIDLEIKIEDSTGTVKSTGQHTKAEMKKNFDELKDLFPNTDKFAHFPITRSLSGKSEEHSFNNYCTLIESNSLTFDQVKDALNYEIWWRKKASLMEDKNKLTFMKGFDPWLNSPDNIEVQLSEMQKDQEYKEFKGSDVQDYFEHHDKFSDL